MEHKKYFFQQLKQGILEEVFQDYLHADNLALLGNRDRKVRRGMLNRKGTKQQSLQIYVFETKNFHAGEK